MLDVRWERGSTSQSMRSIRGLKADVIELKSDMKVGKAAVTEQSGGLADHERRLTILERAA